MLNYEIEGKNVEVKFTLGAINALDQIYSVEMHGIKFGFGVQHVLSDLEQGSPIAVFNVLQAVQVDNVKVGKFAIEKFMMENDNVEQLCEDIIEEIKKQPLTKAIAKKMEITTQEAQAEA
ncbi:tail assembly chaperone [Enterococcus faecium]|nr:tail assembly chaperone [Enterococcus faecium]